MVSITKRLILAASVVLAGFIGLTGLALEKSFRENAEIALKDRLQGFVYTLLAAAEVSREGLTVKDLPDARFYTPESGLYARVYSQDDPVRWESPSLLGVNMRFPEGITGQFIFERENFSHGEFLAVSYTVIWEVADFSERRYTFSLAENLATFYEQIAGFRQNLWAWLGGLALVLLIIQVVILRWGLAPLHQVVEDLKAIEKGDKSELEGEYPEELEELTASLNDLLHNERALQTRYRHSLGDLAHSLKTPLAVLQGEIELCQESAKTVEVLNDQIERMNRIVKYQLHRAVSSGSALAAPLAVAPIAEKIISSLQKVYRDKAIVCQSQLAEDAVFHGDEGDLYEIMGNLLDNAHKWCGQTVQVNVEVMPGRRKRVAVHLVIEDDGPGVPDEQKQQILKRGVRADEKTPGWGIGLSIVTEIVDGYGGQITVSDSVLGGAQFDIRLP